MANPLLALAVETPDIAGSFARGQAQRQEMQTAKLGNMLTQYKLQQAQAADQRTNALSQLYQQHGPGLAQGKPEAINALAQVDPEGAIKVRTETSKAAETDLKLAMDRVDFIGRSANSILNAPPAARPLLYQRALQQASDLGINVSGAPKEYSDDAVAAMRDQAVSVKDQIAQRQQAENAKETARHNRASEGIQVRGQNLTDARARENNSAEVSGIKAPAGYRYKADGKSLEFIPGGPADPSKGAGKKAPTEDQAKNTQLYTRAAQQLKILEGDDKTPGTFDQLGMKGNQFGAAQSELKVPGVGLPLGLPKGWVTSEGYQRASNALTDIAQTYLYSVSGAAAGKEEVEKIVESVTPRFGESDASKADKKARVRQMVESIKLRATPSNTANSGVIDFNDLPDN